MQEQQEKLVWFFAGAAIGAAIALLYAPASGQETRKKIVKSTERGRAAFAESGKEMMEKGREIYNKGRKLADEAAEVFENGRKLVQG